MVLISAALQKGELLTRLPCSLVMRSLLSPFDVQNPALKAHLCFLKLCESNSTTCNILINFNKIIKFSKSILVTFNIWLPLAKYNLLCHIVIKKSSPKAEFPPGNTTEALPWIFLSLIFSYDNWIVLGVNQYYIIIHFLVI